LVNHFDITLSATFETAQQGTNIMRRFMEGAKANASTTTSVPLQVNPTALVLSLGAGVSILGAIVASLFASLKASRMKPQEALRNIE
jgi:ABC-type lipoprotein release transport system permease subunit